MNMSQQNSYLRNENIISLFAINNFIIPEIQREYVWGQKCNDTVLCNFLNSLKNRAKVCSECNHAYTEEDQNIGFIYSYKPPYVTLEHERYLDEFLIDGQQRLTTIFFLLMYLSIRENRIVDFMNIIRFDEYDKTCAFSYNVRDCTQNFLIDLLTKIKKSGKEQPKEKLLSLIKIEIDSNNLLYLNESFFLSDYRRDTSIQGMLGTLKKIEEIFGNNQGLYFDYILTSIKFWHFKTEATSQGEELYITMNSRGEKLEENETKKGRCLPQDKLMEYGKEWEMWQDYFWKNRRKGLKQTENCNINADKGFNEFIRCIDGYERLKQGKSSGSNNIEYLRKGYFLLTTLLKYCEESKQRCEFTSWIDEYVNTIWFILNYQETEWNLAYEDKNKFNNQGNDRNKTILIWPLFYFLEKTQGKKELDLFLNLLRFFYVRYNNYNRSTKRIIMTVDLFIKNGKIIDDNGFIDDEQNDEDETRSFLTKNEKEEYAFLNSYQGKSYCNGDEYKTIQSLIWKFEDHCLNKVGKGYNNVNSNHLIQYNCKQMNSDPKAYINKVMKTFYTLFGEEDDKYKNDNDFIELGNKIKTLLIYYDKNDDSDDFCKKRSPWYYNNYEFNDWKRIVRSKAFCNKIFPALLNAEDPKIELNVLLEDEKKKFWNLLSLDTIKNKKISLREKLIIYSEFIDIWKYGNIAECDLITNGDDPLFFEEKTIYSIDANFKGVNILINDKPASKYLDKIKKLIEKYSS